MAAGANTTKFQAGGSGDNIVADGYIKTVEKVWLDSYTFSQTGTNTTIDIAVLPENKKIVAIDVEIETTATQTNGTVSIGYSTDATIGSFLAPTTLTTNGTRTSISLPSPGLFSISAAPIVTQFNGALAGFQNVTGGTATTISVKLNNWTSSSGTLKSVVRWT